MKSERREPFVGIFQVGGRGVWQTSQEVHGTLICARPLWLLKCIGVTCVPRGKSGQAGPWASSVGV